MFAAAQIVFRNEQESGFLDWLAEELRRRLPFALSRTEWRGYATTIPQLHVATRPVALTIQLDEDEEYVPGEISDLADRLGSRIDADTRGKLDHARSRLDVMSATPSEPVGSDGLIVVAATTDLDPSVADVELVLTVLSEVTEGFIVDLVNDRVRVPGTSVWLPGEAA